MYEDLFKIKHQSLILLRERGYVIPSEEADLLNENALTKFKEYLLKRQNEPPANLAQFIMGRVRPSMSNIYYKNQKSCLVYFSENSGKKISKAEVRIFCQMITDFYVDEAIIISAVDVSSEIQQFTCDNISKNDSKTHGQFIQYFKDDELLYNPMEHVMVPHHRILTDEEVKYMKEVDKVNPRKLPQISSLDPIAKRLGARKDDIIEITRDIFIKDSLIEQEITYRVVFIPQISSGKK